MIATILVGLAVVTLMAANQSFTMVNGAGINISTSEFLAEQVREFTTAMDVVDPQTDTEVYGAEEAMAVNYDDLDDLDGVSFCPPIGADRQPMTAYSAFTQQVSVDNVSGGNFEQVVTDHSTPFVRVTVTVLFNGEEIASSSWIRTKCQ
jgi:hypothetical protein